MALPDPAGHDRSQGKLTTACLKPLLDGKAVHLRRLYLTDQSIGFEQVLKLIKKRGKVLEVRCPPACAQPSPAHSDSLHPVNELSNLFLTVSPYGRLRLASQTVALAAACMATWADLELKWSSTTNGIRVAHSEGSNNWPVQKHAEDNTSPAHSQIEVMHA